MRVGRIPYVNCYPVYGAIDRGVVPLGGKIVTGVPSALNRRMAEGTLDISVVSAVEYARDARRYLLLPDLAISCDGPVRSVMLFSRSAAEELDGKRVIVSKSSMTSVALVELLFENVWHARPDFVAGDAEMSDIASFDREPHEARLVIGDAALVLRGEARPHVIDSTRVSGLPSYPFAYDLGEAWKSWTGLPFVFAVWVAQRAAPVAQALGIHASLITSRNWGLEHLATLATQASKATGVSEPVCLEYLSGLDYGLSYEHLAGLTEFFRRLVAAGRVPNGTLAFLPAA
ncbi:MAG TPA: menaquinone biosynthesis protein [Gemmatimonadaceae bacterium]